MLDINLIRNNSEEVKEALAKRNYKVDFSEFMLWDKERKDIIQTVEELKARRNKVSKEIPMLKKEGKDVTEIISEMAKLKDDIASYDEKLKEIDDKIFDFVAKLPNLPAADVVAGDKENNQVVTVWGEKRVYDFEPKNHVDLAESLGLIDYVRGSKLGGNGFWIYKDKGAILEWALLNYFIEEHLKDGYTFVLPPHILTYESGFTAGQFPKFEDDVFKLEQENKGYMQFLLPTAETALINYHRNEVLSEEELPKKYFAYTPCYRKEAGSYRAEERGMIRGHQFNKVEMFQFAKPEDSDAALEELVGKAERLVRGLGLHYQLSKLAAADCSASMTKTYDIEVWIESMNVYKEVSSASNAGDYQARRGNMKFKRSNQKKTEFMHTLNASGLATSRLIPAILEQFQQEDGSVIVPEPLRKWTNFDIIK
jgi:seryl-tRNA synthetase